MKNIGINQEKKENILSFEEYFDGFLEPHEDGNGQGPITTGWTKFSTKLY